MYLYLLLYTFVCIIPLPQSCRNVLDVDGVTCISGCPVEAYADINSQCQPCNGQCLSFSEVTYIVQVFENAPTGTVLTAVSVSDLRGTGRPVQFEITAGNMRRLFDISQQTGILTLNASLDFEMQSMHSLTVTVFDVGSRPISTQSASASVVIIVQDVNDNPPVFSQEVYTASVSENNQIGISLLSVEATDADSEQFARINFFLENGLNFFELDNVTGELMASVSFDFEVQQSYTLNILAIDSGTPFLSASAQVVITILNQNDNRPVFEQTSYFVEISELFPMNSEIVQVQANDLDGSIIVYDVIEGNREAKFELDRMTGTVTLISSLDYETTETYTLLILASDGLPNPLPSGTAAVVIQVLDENDNAPVFVNDSYVATVVENDPPLTVALSVVAIDFDSGNNSAISYAITSGDPSIDSLFAIDSTTGEVFVQDALDRESRSSYNFIVTATDQGDSPMSASAQVMIFVADQNDNPPIFTEPSLIVNISESTSVGASLATFQATDADLASNAEIVFELVGSDVLPFTINSTTGVVSLRQQLDYEMNIAYITNVIVSDLGVLRLTSTATLEVQVIDVNDNPPVFSEVEYLVAIPENLSIGSSVLQVQASDEDSGENAIVTYRILAGNQQNIFSIDSLTGLITLRNVVNFEQQTEYTLTVSADNSEVAVPLSSNVNARILVTEVNEAKPVFSEAVYQGSVLENQPPGVTVATVMATDTDSGTSGEISYQITTENVQNLFTVTDEGAIVTLTSLDREQTEAYELVITAIDRGTPPLSASTRVEIAVLDLNDLPPTFSITDPYMSSLAENVFPGTVIVTTPPLEASDADSDGPNSDITFQIVDGDPDGVFSIDPLTGQLRSEGAIDFESNNRFELIIEAMDGGTPMLSGNATVIINILDQNDNPPQILNAPTLVMFTEGQDMLLVTENVTVTDNDTLPLRLVTLTLSSPTIPPNQIGSISLVTPPSNTMNNGLTLEYSGARSPEDVTLLLRTLTYTNTVPEPDPSSRFVTVRVSDGDFDARFIVEILTELVNDNAPVVDLDTSSPQNGSSSIFIEGSRPIVITRSISITDNDRDAFGLASLTIELLDAQDGASEGLLLPQVTTLDVQYSSNNHSFSLSASDITSFVDFESALSSILYYNEADEPLGPLTRTIQVTAFDGGLASLPVLAAVTISLVNDPPILILGGNGDYLVEFVEDEGPISLTSASQFQLSDSDSPLLQNATVILLEAPDQGSERIQINVSIPSSLTVISDLHSMLIEGPASPSDFAAVFRAVSYNNVLQDPTTSIRRVEFSVSDGTAETTATTLIFFSAANDPPLLDLNGPEPGSDYSVTFIEESDPIMITSGQLSLQDVDSSVLQSATIQLFNNIDGTSESLVLSQFDPSFSITILPDLIQVTGLASLSAYANLLRSVSYANNADEPREGTREVYFSVSDGFANSTLAVTTIDVVLVNDPPALTLNGGEIYSTVYVEEALSVSIVDSNNPVILQDSDSGSLAFLAVTLSNALDGEAAESISSSDQSLEYVISRIQVQSDVTFNFTFSPELSTLDNFRQLISSLTYRNTLTEPSAGVRNITFIVSDGIDRSPSQQSSVNVILLNDNPPVFQQTIYQAQVHENAVGVLVTTVQATDVDSNTGPFAQHGTIQYSFVSGNEAGSFSIDPLSGEIRVIVPKDRELGIANPVLIVLASNPVPMSVPSIFPTALVFITVQDENDNIPQFLDEPYSFQIIEHSAIGTTVGMVRASDADVSSNAQIDYFLSGGNSVFVIDRLSGTLAVANSVHLDREMVSSYALSVTAMDRGSPPTSNTTLVTIDVTDVNDNAPIFTSSLYSRAISEAENIGTPILTVSAIDVDFGTNSEILYTLQDTSVFSVNSSSGVINLASVLDRELQSLYSFSITASDGGSPRLSSTSRVSITISDENDNPPIFQQSSYFASISESSSPGQLVLSVVAIDADVGRNANITYYIQGPAIPFEVDPEQGTVQTASSLDRESTEFYEFDIIAEDGGSPPMRSSVPVNVTVTDANDNAPIFSQPSYISNMTENVPVGTVVTSIEALDNDAAESAVIEYSLASPSNVFNIDPSTGEVFTVGSIDREERDLYQLDIIATDSGQPPMSSQVSLTIVVLDVNDNEPVFESDIYDFMVFENDVSGMIGMLVASDEDTGSNAQVLYTIVSEGAAVIPFEINPSSGELSSLIELDREAVQFYNFSVVASDNGNPSLSVSTVVTIAVLDRNDNSPEFTQFPYSVSVLESIAIGTSLTMVTAVDQDSGTNAEIRFRIISGTPVGPFTLSPLSGEIQLTQSLNAETATIYYLTIQAIDSGAPSLSSNATVEVIVMDVNDNPIQMSVTSIMVTYVEEQPPVIIAPDITVEDMDVSATVANSTVELLTSNHCCEDQLILSSDLLDLPGVQLINENQILIISGPINSSLTTKILRSVQYVNTLPEPESNSVIARFTTSDGVFSDSLDVTISVAIINDNPPIVLLNGSSLNSSIDFMENSPGELIAAMSQITDDDSGSQTLNHITIMLQNPQNNEFLRAEASGLVTVLPPSGGVALLLSGPAPLIDFSNVLSSVQYHNLEDNPQSPFQRLIQVVANDSELTSGSSYAIVTVLPVNDPPYLQLSSTIDFNTSFTERGAAVSLTSNDLLITDPDSPSLLSAIVQILDELDIGSEYLLAQPPASIALQRVSPGELRFFGSAPISDYIMALRVQYLNNASNPTPGPRSVEFLISDGELSAVAISEVLVVVVNDAPSVDLNGPLSQGVDYQISFTEEGPAVNLASSSATISDSDDVMLSSLTIRILTPDNRMNERLTVTSTSGSISSRFDSESFTLLLSGQAPISEYERLLRSVQYENSADEPSGQQRQLQVVANDGELESVPAVVTVLFVYTNDPPVVILDNGGNYNTMFVEEGPPVSVVNQREAQITDVDSPSLTYLFIEVSNVLDELEVVNYTDPVGGLLVTEVINSDMQTISYNFTYPFMMPVSVFNSLLLSLIYQNQEPEPNASEMRIFTVSVSDGLFVSAQVVSRISIRLVDDNQPEFLQPSYRFVVQEGSELRFPIGAVQAEDPDIGDTFLYRLELADEIPFTINSTTGVIEVSGTLDRELEASHVLQVMLTRPAPPFSVFDDQARVQIEIADINDNRPEFNQSSFNIEIREDAVLNLTIAVFDALDIDEGSNAELQYTLSGTTVFQIDALTGELSIVQELDRETAPSHEFIIFARDSGQPPLSSSASVTVTVLDANDQTPQFLQSSYSTQIVETTTVGTTVLQLSARDTDIGSNAELTFQLVPSSAQFTVNSLTGVVNVSGTLTPGVYNFSAIVSDRGTPQLSSSVPTTVEVISFDSTRPMFSQPLYEESVLENSSAGVSVLTVNAADPVSENPVSYATSDSPNSAAFNLDPVSGLLTVSGAISLDRETNDVYQLQILATSADSLRVGTAQVVIRISDANDFPPVFSQPSYSFQIVENVNINSMIGAVVATDMRDIGINAEITNYSTSSFNFSVDSSGIITTRIELDRETQNTHSFLVFATDAGIPSQTGSAVVTVTVLDENDQFPVFSQDMYEGQLAERQPPGTAVLTVSTMDDDLGSNAQVMYSSNSSEFSIHPETGLISSLVELDYESSTQLVYEVTVFAFDSGVPSLTSTALALIRVIDIDDSRPQFSMDRYSATVLEEQLASSVLRVVATDRDSGPNNPISYSITAGEPNMHFSISSSGTISAQRPLDRETSAQHTLTVVASNLDAFGATLSATTTVVVDVLDINDNAPQFLDLPYRFSVSEGAAGGEVVGILTATDADEGSNANVTDFTVIQGNLEGAFELNAQSGILRVQPSILPPLDRESIDTYQLTVRVSDSGQPVLSTEVNVTITVTDVNDISPEFDPDVSYITGVRENAPLGTIFFDADASDGDLGSNALLSYSLSEPNPLFAINETTGEVYLQGQLDFESQQLYNITLVAVDVGQPQLTGSVSLEINVFDADDQPVQFTLDRYFASVFEDASFGTPVLRVTAQDPDTVQGNPITYLLEERGDSNELPFSVDSQSGQISVLRPLDRELISEYRFSVFATNTPGQRASATVTIEVLDVNDVTPTFPNGPFQFQILESASIGAVLGELAAIDGDAGSAGSVEYSLISAPETLAVNSSTGVLTVAQNLDFETAQQYSFTVVAVDGGTPSLSGSSIVMVEIQDVNDNRPLFVHESNLTFVPENVATGTIIFTAEAEDTDSGTNALFIYSLAMPSSQFSIDFLSGEVNVTSTLVLQTYELILVATDMGTPQLSSTTILEIVVTDTNEPPVFSQPTYSAVLSENLAVGALVVQVVATDPDSGTNAEIQYSIDPQQTFTIEPTTGRVLLSQSLDFEQVQSYAVTLRAIDSGTPPFTVSAQLTVEVTDINDNAPEFLEQAYVASVPEDIPVSAIVISVNASDADSSSNAAITYSLIGGNTEGLFAIDSLTGDIFSLQMLDYESVERVDLLIGARDGGQPAMTSTMTVTIMITDVDDNEPIFEQNEYRVAINENIQVGDTVVIIQANDSDSGFNAVIVYTLINATDLPFIVDEESGTISVTSPGIDRETEDVYIFMVEAFNPFSPVFTSTVVITIEVLDTNDNSPMFNQQSFQFSVSEATLVGSTIGRVIAQDRDQGLSAVITFTFEPGSQFVSVDSETGVLTVIRQLDFETIPQLDLTIIARDSGTPQLSSSATVRISVQDSNDERPQITASLSQFTFQEGSIPIRIGTGIIITDPDTFPLQSATVNLYADSSSTPASAADFVQLDRAFSESQGLQLSASSHFISINGNASVSTYTRVLSELEFGNTADEPTLGTRLVQLRLFDGQFFSDILSLSITVQLLNDNPPLLDLSASADGLGYQTTFTEGGMFVFIVGSDLTLVDVDGSDIQNITVTLTNNMDGTAERLISAFSFGQVRILSSENTIFLQGPASPNEFELALQAVSYENLADEPSNPQLARIIEFIASDADFSSEPVLATVLIQPVNDPPFIQLGLGTQDIILSYTEDLGSLPLTDGNLSLNDSDSELLSFINVTIVDYQPGVDQLFFSTNGSNITGEFLSGTLLLSGPATISEFIPVTQTVAYVNFFVTNNQIEQLQGGKTIQFSANDGMNSSLIASAFVTFTAVNDPPVLDLNGPLTPGTSFSAIFEEGAAAVFAVSAQLTITDVDSQQLQFATVRLSGVLDPSNEVLFTTTSAGGITSTFDTALLILTLTGPAMAADFQQVLRSLSYQNNAPEPNIGERTLTFIVSDGEAQSTPATSTVTVVGFNDPPELSLVPTGLSFVEGGSPITLVMPSTVSLVDGDNQTLTYLEVILENAVDGATYEVIASSVSLGGLSVVTRAAGTSITFIFSFNPSSLGTVDMFSTLIAGLTYSNTADEPQTGSRGINISTSDGVDTSVSIAFDVDIQLVNDNVPVFGDEVVVVSLLESIAIGTTVYQAEATDIDIDSQISYSLNNESSTFNISSTSGTVVLTDTLDRETISEYALYVEASDGLNSDLLLLIVSVEDINDNAPVFSSSLYSATVNENAPIGTSVVDIDATDGDIGTNGQIRYTITGGNQERAFTVDENNGLVTLSDALNFEATQSYSLVVTAQDFGSPTLSSMVFVIVTITDQNDNPPVFIPSSDVVEWNEDTSIGTILYTAQATDSDGNTQLVYSISNQTQLFSISATSGSIVLEESLDFEQETSHLVVVEASDGVSAAIFQLTILVRDVNDNPPIFVQDRYDISVSENISIGEDVLAGLQPLQAMDLDQVSNAAVQFFIESGDSRNQFAVNLISSDTAELIVTGGLDRESEDEYNLVIVARDPSNSDFNTSASVVISVLDINDNTPQFDMTLYNFSVAEHSSMGTLVGIVSATDNDIGVNGLVTYSIISGDPDGNFMISSNSEIQISSQTLDRESINHYTLTVRAEDGGNPSLTALTTVLISIMDINDNPPIFTQSTVSTTLLENSPPGTVLSDVAILAEDRQDVGTNAEIVYLVHPDNATLFSIHPITGLLTALVSFDYETDPTNLEITVIATDSGIPPLSAQAQVTVTLTDVNEFIPQFTMDSYSVEISEDARILASVLTVTAEDFDGDTGAFIEYSLIELEGTLPFAIDNHTGVVYTTDTLNRESIDSYQLMVVASNPLGSPVLSSSVTVTVTVLDINDNAPVFVQESYVAAITTGFEVGNQILSVSASDRDAGLNGTIQYSLADANGRFTITASIGVITSTQLFETTGTFTLMVIASDQGTPSLSSNTSVTINIIQPVDIQFTQTGTGFLLQQGSSALQQQFGLFVNSPPGSQGTISGSLGGVQAEATYFTDLPQAVNLRGVVLSEEAWHDQPEIQVLLQVMDELGDVHCSPIQVVIRALPDTTLQRLANLNPQVGNIHYVISALSVSTNKSSKYYAIIFYRSSVQPPLLTAYVRAPFHCPPSGSPTVRMLPLSV